jgi:hypothetical protein
VGKIGFWPKNKSLQSCDLQDFSVLVIEAGGDKGSRLEHLQEILSIIRKVYKEQYRVIFFSQAIEFHEKRL